MPKKSFRSVLEQRLGRFPDFLIYYVLEWIIMIMILVAGILAIISDYFAEFCELKIPCLLCTKIDQVLVHKNPDFYYQNSVCQAHKEDMSSLAFCNMHKKLSDIRNMCEGCLVWFTVEKERSGFVGGVRKSSNIDQSYQMSETAENCSCCGEALKLKSQKKYKHSLSFLKAPAPSPRAPLLEKNYDTQVKFEEHTKSELPLPQDDPAPHNAEYMATLIDDSVPFVTQTEDINEDASRSNKEVSSMEKVDQFTVDPDHEVSSLNSKSLMALYMELEEERNASAVAANNAMAMITRLQGEKAAVQMEALQYKRMMEEQAQYDQEALQLLQDVLLRREADVKALESELLTYREPYGQVKSVGSEICEVDADDYYQELKSQSNSPFSEKSDSSSDQNENERPYTKHGLEEEEESCLDFEGERCFVSNLLDDLEKKILKLPLLDEQSNSDDTNDDDKLARLRSEVSSVRERLRAINEADEEGIEVLNEIAQHIRKLRSSVESATDDGRFTISPSLIQVHSGYRIKD